MMSTPHVYAAPVPPYSLPMPGPSPIVRTAPMRPVPAFAPAISYKAPGAGPEAPKRAPSSGVDAGTLAAVGLLAFTALLCLIACAVHAYGLATLTERWAANTSLTSEARELGLAAARQAAFVRLGIFGPLALAFAAASTGIFAFAGRRRARR
ncbi:MAG: hypothetical protein IPG50_07305 [Myxococcales bacterium]|nr:hypothetical protein [Myxococcales bacterium]